LKFNVQELQRDLTLRRCLVKASAMQDLQEEITELQKDLDDLLLLTEKKQPALEKVDTQTIFSALLINIQFIFQVKQIFLTYFRECKA
jgi:hypothetical protein